MTGRVVCQYGRRGESETICLTLQIYSSLLHHTSRCTKQYVGCKYTSTRTNTQQGGTAKCNVLSFFWLLFRFVFIYDLNNQSKCVAGNIECPFQYFLQRQYSVGISVCLVNEVLRKEITWSQKEKRNYLLFETMLQLSRGQVYPSNIHCIIMEMKCGGLRPLSIHSEGVQYGRRGIAHTLWVLQLDSFHRTSCACRDVLWFACVSRSISTFSQRCGVWETLLHVLLGGACLLFSQSLNSYLFR